MRKSQGIKSSLPEKICLVCLRPFSWRKKWQRDWSNVKYCSKRCAGDRNSANKNVVTKVCINAESAAKDMTEKETR